VLYKWVWRVWTWFATLLGANGAVALVGIDSGIDYYHASAVQFCHWVNVILAQRKRFTSTSFFFVAAVAYSRLLCEFFSVTNVNTFLSVHQMKISFSNCFERLMIHMTADSANGRIEWWICDWSSWHSTSSSTVATFSSVFACMICCSVTAVGTSFENLYFKR